MNNRQLGRDMQVEFQARFQAKQARREAQKAAKQDPILKKQIQDLLKNGETQKAYQKAKMLLSKQALAQQMDQMADMAELSAAQIQANNSMNRMTHMMGQSSRTMSVAQRNMNPEKTLVTLEQFKQQNEEYAMSNGIYQDAITQSTSTQVSEDALLKNGETQKAYQKAKMLLSKQALAQQMDQMADMAELSAAQIQANNSMNRMTHMMGQSSRTMSVAQRNMNPEKTLVTLEQFKQQNEEYAMSNGIYQDAITQSTSTQVSEDAVHELLGKLADDAGVQLSQQLESATPAKEEPAREEPTAEEEDALQQRLRALRA
ncbi:hypothetical protein BN1708_005912 [Verticillium longisporum]|uniref:Uncharacterized protein n=1 Tax=Verticillium longisporum TaxID=100787 RepID=A0A0G4MEX1_VERLO|nr:hypothetical protein BN1708_005912 [Verticillium longisporum]